MPWKRSPPSISTVPSGFSERRLSIHAASTGDDPTARPERRWPPRIAPWKSVVTALVFVMLMFVTFEIAFDVLMPKGPIETMLGF